MVEQNDTEIIYYGQCSFQNAVPCTSECASVGCFQGHASCMRGHFYLTRKKPRKTVVLPGVEA